MIRFVMLFVLAFVFLSGCAATGVRESDTVLERAELVIRNESSQRATVEVFWGSVSQPRRIVVAAKREVAVQLSNRSGWGNAASFYVDVRSMGSNEVGPVTVQPGSRVRLHISPVGHPTVFH